jgi:nicotinate-nucleotide adenylyltransferase
LSSRLGLFGGTFNPIHHGHLIAVQETMRALGLDSTQLIPTHHPPHREEPNVDADSRARMTELAVSDDPNLSTSRIEMERDGPSYTVETVELVNQELPNQSLFLLIGADELLQFREWHRWEDLMDLCTIVGMSRPGFNPEKVDEDLLDRCEFANIPEIEISSSTIRTRLRNHEPVRYFLPAPVRHYINQHGLYRS